MNATNQQPAPGATIRKRFKVKYSGWNHESSWKNQGFTVFQDDDGNEYTFAASWCYEGLKFLTGVATISGMKYRNGNPVYIISEFRQVLTPNMAKRLSITDKIIAERYLIDDDEFERWVAMATAQAQARPAQEYTPEQQEAMWAEYYEED